MVYYTSLHGCAIGISNLTFLKPNYWSFLQKTASAVCPVWVNLNSILPITQPKDLRVTWTLLSYSTLHSSHYPPPSSWIWFIPFSPPLLTPHWLTSPSSLTSYVYKASCFVPWFPPWTLCLDSVRKPNKMILWKYKSDHMSLLAQNPPMASSVTLMKCPTLTLICKAPHSLASWSFSWLNFLIVAWSFSQV